MKNQIIVTVAVCLTCIIFSASAQWTPDPFCPYPSDHVTRYPYYGNCSVYWECFQGAKYVMECPEGLEFNAPLQQCDAPEIANCDPFASTTGRSTTPHTTETGSTEPISTSTSDGSTTAKPYPPCADYQELTYFPYLGDCTKYWECYAGQAYLYHCPSNLWWHQEISQCDYPGDYCNNSTTTPKTTEAPTTATTVTDVTDTTATTQGNDPRCTEGGTSYWPQPGDCHKYIECVDGVSYLVTCPENLFFSDRVKQCVRVDESECCQVYECNPSFL